ncbi:hypothetical protein TNCV_1801431 [Trichonephila clavipes]|nr:hypothetical protein TNCV_1801431 [Trichonephila clavipes]
MTIIPLRRVKNTTLVVSHIEYHQIVTFMQEESEPVSDETDEEDDNNSISNSLSNANAFSGLERAMEGYEQQSECCPTQLLLLKRINDLAVKKTKMYNGIAKK